MSCDPGWLAAMSIFALGAVVPLTVVVAVGVIEFAAGELIVEWDDAGRTGRRVPATGDRRLVEHRSGPEVAHEPQVLRLGPDQRRRGPRGRCRW